MSPEQIRGQRLDGRSDIFSLGVVLYELVTGHAPFEGNNSIETLAAVLSQDAPPLDRYAPHAPISLKLILSKALKKDREARYQKAGHLRAALVKLKTELELKAKLESDGPVASTDESAIYAALDDAFATARDLDTPTSQTTLRERLEPVGGAVPLGSMFYIVRKTDHEFQAAIARQDSIVLVKGARQVGKTSLLARGLQQARDAGARVILTDFQKLAARYLISVDELLLTLAESFADQLDLDVSPGEVWNARLSPGINFERYLRRVVFSKIPGAIVWGLDEIDRLFSCDFGSEVFGLFRSWHNERALDPQGPWRRFTLAVAYATEAHLFMVRMATRLREDGAGVAVLDLTAVGNNLEAEQWYGGLLLQMGRRLGLEDELLDFWVTQSRIGPLQRWMEAIRHCVLPRYPSQIVIFIDEIDAVRSLPFSTDEFFAGIRELYNRRSEEPELKEKYLHEQGGK